MSVELTYLGRFGNHIFIYVCGRLFAMENGLYLRTPIFQNSVFTVTPHEPGENLSEPVIELKDGDDLFAKKYPPAGYRLNGYWQCGMWYQDRRDKILSFMRAPPVPFRNTKDIVMHLRLSDFKKYNIAVHPSWYLSILKEETFDHLYIVTDEVDMDYLSAFKSYDPLIACGDPMEDWNLLRGFDKMIISTSTFAWWAAFFSEAKKIYTFKRYQNGVDMPSFKNGVVVDGPLLHEA